MNSGDWDDVWADRKYNRKLYDRIMWIYMRRLLRGTRIKKGSTLLDIGCGEGGLSLYLARKYNMKVTLVDFSKKAIERAVERYREQGIDVSYYYGDIFDMEIGERFDVVMSEGLIEHFYRSKRIGMIRRHMELVKENGYIIIFVPAKTILYPLWIGMINRAGSKRIREIPFTMSEIRKYSKALGLDIIKVTKPFRTWIGFIARVRG